MSMSKNWIEFKQAIKEYNNVENTFLFLKGRVALFAILKAIEISIGDEIILPSFTCVVVPNPILYMGAKPVYVDIDPKTFTIDINKIEKKISGKTKAILAQNTFGLSSDLNAIIEIAQKYNFWVIEDCAHGFGGHYKKQKNGTVADAAFYSTQWNKPFSTGLGGIAITKNENIAAKLAEMERKAKKSSKKEEFILNFLLKIKEKIIYSNTYWTALKTYRYLSEKNLIVGSSQGYELEKPIMPKDFLKGFTGTQAKKGLEYFNKINGKYKIDIIIEHRKKVSNIYKKILFDLGFEPPFEPDYSEHTYLKFPLLVKDRKKVFYLAEKEKIELGDWFLSPIHPVQTNYELWNYSYGENPIGEFAARHIINLPTHERINENEIDKIYAFLKRNKDEIIGCSVPQNFNRMDE